MYPQSCLSFSMHPLLHMTQQFLVATSKVKRNCSYTCQQSQHMRESLGTRLQCLLPLISLHFLLLIGFYFSKVHDNSTALRNICCASVIFSIQTHPCMANEYILYDVFFSQVYIYLSTVCIHTASLVATFPTLAFSQFEHNGSHISQQPLLTLNIFKYPSAYYIYLNQE